MFENPGMPKKIVGSAGDDARPRQTRQSGQAADQPGWAPPRLAKLQPGTVQHERAKAAFDLLKAVGSDRQGKAD